MPILFLIRVILRNGFDGQLACFQRMLLKLYVSFVRCFTSQMSVERSQVCEYCVVYAADKEQTHIWSVRKMRTLNLYINRKIYNIKFDRG